MVKLSTKLRSFLDTILSPCPTPNIKNPLRTRNSNPCPTPNPNRRPILDPNSCCTPKP
eukprot:UN16991